MVSQSYTVAEASRELGVSIPTVKLMYRKGELAGFLTPGGHLRIAAESVDAIRKNGRTRASSAFPSVPSSVLQARRERIEELNLDGQELRARRELQRLRSEESEDRERQAAQGQEREANRQLQLEQARAERLRQERIREETHAEQRRVHLRQQVQLALNVTLPSDLPLEKQRELAEALDSELARANVADVETARPIIVAITNRFTAAFIADERARQRRTRILESAVREIRWERGSCETDEAEAATVVRAAFSNLTPDATEQEIRYAAKAAIAPIQQKIEQREHRKGIVESGVRRVFPYLERLHRAGGISREILADSSFVHDLEAAVRRRLLAELANEDPGAVRRMVHEVVDRELDRPE